MKEGNSKLFSTKAESVKPNVKQAVRDMLKESVNRPIRTSIDSLRESNKREPRKPPIVKKIESAKDSKCNIF